jgi:diguanylate cyclase (GGDEF)-like protein
MRRPKRALRAASVLLAAASIAAPRAQALDPGKAITQYGHDVWGVDQGLPQNSVQTILQSHDGYLWLGTEEGLVRFDGVRFLVFDRRTTPGFTDNYISALLEDAQGVIWIGTRQGGVLRYSDGEFRAWMKKDGLPNDFVRCLALDRRGRVWLGTDAGLARWTGEGFERFTTREGLSSDAVRSICEDRNGDLWIGTRGGGVVRYHQGAFTAYKKTDGLASDDVWSTLAARDGTVWIGTAGGGLSHFSGDRFTTIPAGEGQRSAFIAALLEDRAGNLWVGADGGGVARLSSGRWTTYTARDGLSNDFVQAFLEDREGNLWIGTQGGGLNRLVDRSFTLYSTREGLSRDAVWSISEDRAGAMWIGTLGGGLNRLDERGVRVFMPRDGLPSDAVWSTLQASDGSLWIGTRGAGLARWKDGVFTRFGTAQGLPGDVVLSLLEDHRGTLWIGTSAGLAHWTGRQFEVWSVRDGLPNASVLSLAESHNGEIWIGTRGGLSRLSDDKVKSWTTALGLSNDTVYDIHEDASGELWCGTAGGGIDRIGTGSIRSYGSGDGLFDDVVYRILEDGQGNFWMSCNRGIFRVSRRDFDRYDHKEIRAIPSIAYSRADGLRNPECNGGFQPAGWRARDGRLWFPTIAGAAVVDPAHLRVNTSAPPVVLEALLVDGKPWPARSGIRVPPGKGNLELHYTALSFVAPERVAFRYRLEGLDNDWVDAGRRRVAYYPHLPSGKYTFRVTACNDSGVWAAQPVSLAFIVEPRFYQTVWFFLLCAIALALGGEGAYVLRVHRLKARQKELEDLVAERTRQLAEANQVLERLSLADPLTGAANRRQFERVLEFERRRSERTGAPLALLMIDIDEFKVLNDAFGHLVGDECLKHVADELMASVRGAGDLVARYGGEEFAVILAGTDGNGALILAERIRARVEALAIPLDPNRPGRRLTISIGVAGSRTVEQLSAESLVAAADQALYRAKQGGRNRVERGEPREASEAASRS